MTTLEETAVDEPRPSAPAGEDDPVADDTSIEFGNWEFIGTAPTIDDVRRLLATLKPVWGIAPVEYWEFVQPLPQTKNVGTKTAPDYKQAWTLYFSVAGRIKMINDAAEKNGWRLDFEPEPNVPEGNAAGYVVYGDDDDDRIVYRELCEISIVRSGNTQYTDPIVLGRKPGTAWVPARGGSGAVSSNRFEKVETSARGRSIAAWGFGVLPGSGVASLEEMRDAQQLTDPGSRGRRTREPRGPRQTPEEIKEETRNLINEYQQVTGVSDEGMDDKMKKAFKRMFDKEPPEGSDEPWNLDWLKDGERALLRNRLKQEVEKLKVEASEI